MALAPKKKGKKEEVVPLTEAQQLQLNLSNQAGKYLTLFRASALGRLSDVDALLAKGVKKIDARDDATGQSPLVLAAAAGSKEIVEHLIQNGAAVNGKLFAGMTALHWACKADALPVVQYLVEEAGANTEQEDDAGNSAAHFAARGGFIRILDFLVKVGANFNKKNKQGSTVLMSTVLSGQAAAVAVVLRVADLDLSQQDALGNTALHYAASLGQDQIAKQLLYAGCSKSILNLAGELPVQLVASEGPLAKLLAVTPASPVASSSASPAAGAVSSPAAAAAAAGGFAQR